MSGLVEVFIFGAGTQILKGGPNGVQGHRLEPKSLNGLLAFAVLYQLPEDELAFASGFAGVYQAVDIVPLHQSGNDAYALLAFIFGLELER